ncbi:hypothetical protein JTE90_014839 [Oedothorax gibbosus]|uniref:Uncharacterized protein n=1 Tax=Oedothorax gibbosus TaxID=931172 RepID=A0AAV6TE85_9ARAC|nr:hypothetical protein JTE90_014839 [Oedothorax gibbosus]
MVLGLVVVCCSAPYICGHSGLVLIGFSAGDPVSASLAASLTSQLLCEWSRPPVPCRSMRKLFMWDMGAYCDRSIGLRVGVELNAVARANSNRLSSFSTLGVSSPAQYAARDVGSREPSADECDVSVFYFMAIFRGNIKYQGPFDGGGSSMGGKAFPERET